MAALEADAVEICLDSLDVFASFPFPLLPAKTVAGIERTDEEIVMMTVAVESFMVAVSCSVVCRAEVEEDRCRCDDDTNVAALLLLQLCFV